MNKVLEHLPHGWKPEIEQIFGVRVTLGQLETVRCPVSAETTVAASTAAVFLASIPIWVIFFKRP